MNCECKEPGYCQRHDRMVNKPVIALCQGQCGSRPCHEGEKKLLDQWFQNRKYANTPQPMEAEISVTGRSVFSLIRTLKEEVDLWVRMGKPRVSPEVYEQRQSTCKACSYYNPDADACRICGCNMNEPNFLGAVFAWVVSFGVKIPGKLWMATAGCAYRSPQYPEGKWQPTVKEETCQTK